MYLFICFVFMTSYSPILLDFENSVELMWWLYVSFVILTERRSVSEFGSGLRSRDRLQSGKTLQPSQTDFANGLCQGTEVFVCPLRYRKGKFNQTPIVAFALHLLSHTFYTIQPDYKCHFNATMAIVAADRICRTCITTSQNHLCNKGVTFVSTALWIFL